MGKLNKPKTTSSNFFFLPKRRLTQRGVEFFKLKKIRITMQAVCKTGLEY